MHVTVWHEDLRREYKTASPSEECLIREKNEARKFEIVRTLVCRNLAKKMARGAKSDGPNAKTF